MSRLLTKAEGLAFSSCQPYVATPPGNLVNSLTPWNITGSLVTRGMEQEEGVDCRGARTLYVPVRYEGN